MINNVNGLLVLVFSKLTLSLEIRLLFELPQLQRSGGSASRANESF